MVYSSCVRGCLHGSETWPSRSENELAFLRAEMRMVRQICGSGVKLSDKVAWIQSLFDSYCCFTLRLEHVVTVLQHCRLRWYVHVLRKHDSELLKKCMDFVVDGVEGSSGGDMKSEDFEVK